MLAWKLLRRSDWYTLLIPAAEMEFTRFDRVRRWEETLKALLTPGVLFEELGFRYFGPIDGHDIDAMIETFTAVRDLGGPRLVHVRTQKGKGFPAGESSRTAWKGTVTTGSLAWRQIPQRGLDAIAELGVPHPTLGIRVRAFLFETVHAVHGSVSSFHHRRLLATHLAFS